MILFFWEMLQCNKHFRSFIVDTERAHDFLVLILFYALDQKTDPSKHGVVRMCIFVLQTLSAEPKFAKSLNKHFEGQSSLPASVRVEGFHGSYADYLIVVCFSPTCSFLAALTGTVNSYAHHNEQREATSHLSGDARHNQQLCGVRSESQHDC